MYKLLSFVALFALLAVAFAADAEKSEDQQAAELFYARYGYYPVGYKAYGYSYGNVAAYPYAAAGYPYAAAGYPYAGFPVAAVPATYKTAGFYPAAAAAVVY